MPVTLKPRAELFSAQTGSKIGKNSTNWAVFGWLGWAGSDHITQNTGRHVPSQATLLGIVTDKRHESIDLLVSVLCDLENNSLLH